MDLDWGLVFGDGLVLFLELSFRWVIFIYLVRRGGRGFFGFCLG